MNYWQNKLCLITGGSAGLGLALSRALAQRGARVIVTARTAGPLHQAAETMMRTGGNVQPFVADVTSPADIDRLGQFVRNQSGGVDLVCNCVGLSTRKAILDTTAEDFQHLWEVNFLSAVGVTNQFAADLMARRGHLVNIGSLASKVATRYYGGYPASKFALAAYSQQLRLELGPQGLHVLLVCPGPIKRAANGPRYANTNSAVPAAAQQPGGGAKLKGLDPDRLAERILIACERRQPELVLPAKVRILLAIAALSPRLGDWLLAKATAT